MADDTLLAPFPVQPVPGQQPLGTAKALFDFTAENEDELTLKVCTASVHVRI